MDFLILCDTGLFQIGIFFKKNMGKKVAPTKPAKKKKIFRCGFNMVLETFKYGDFYWLENTQNN